MEEQKAVLMEEAFLFGLLVSGCARNLGRFQLVPTAHLGHSIGGPGLALGGDCQM